MTTEPIYLGNLDAREKQDVFSEDFAKAEVLVSQWIDRAACEGTIDDYFPGKTHEVSPRTKAICASCPVRVECVRHAYLMHLNTRSSRGYFGGLSSKDRSKMTMEEAMAAISKV